MSSQSTQTQLLHTATNATKSHTSHTPKTIGMLTAQQYKNRLHKLPDELFDMIVDKIDLDTDVANLSIAMILPGEQYHDLRVGFWRRKVDSVFNRQPGVHEKYYASFAAHLQQGHLESSPLDRAGCVCADCIKC